MWNHLGLGTASAHALPAHFHGCHPKHLACVTVHGCDVTIIFLIQGNTNNYLASEGWMEKKKKTPRNSCPGANCQTIPATKKLTV